MPLEELIQRLTELHAHMEKEGLLPFTTTLGDHGVIAVDFAPAPMQFLLLAANHWPTLANALSESSEL